MPRVSIPNTFQAQTGPIPLAQLDADFTACANAINDSSLGWVSEAADAGSANNYSVTLSNVPSSYTAGMVVVFIAANTNTGSSTINVNALGSQLIVNPANLGLQGGEISANSITTIVYDGTNFRIVGACPLAVAFGGLSASKTVDCAGATSILIDALWTSGTGLTLSMLHVSYGVPIMVFLNNGTGASTTFSLAMTNPAGTAYTSILAVQSGALNGAAFTNVRSGAGSVTISNSLVVCFTGASYSPLAALFSR